MSKIAMQQEALGQLQAGLIDELEAKGTFQNPETQKIMDKYQKVTILANKKIILSACYGRFIMFKVCVWCTLNTEMSHVRWFGNLGN